RRRVPAPRPLARWRAPSAPPALQEPRRSRTRRKLTTRQIFQGACVVDFDFSPEQLAFRDEVEAFLDANEDPVVFDVTRENMAQVADIPERRALMGKVARQGWLEIGRA